MQKVLPDAVVWGHEPRLMTGLIFMLICECISDICICGIKHSLLASFADRDMIMRHFGSGIGHIDSAACQQDHDNNEDMSDSGSDSDPDLDLMPASQSQASGWENAAMGINMESEEDDSDSDTEDSLDSGLGLGSSDELSESDDDGYASF
jgi:hypothetical protein